MKNVIIKEKKCPNMKPTLSVSRPYEYFKGRKFYIKSTPLI